MLIGVLFSPVYKDGFRTLSSSGGRGHTLGVVLYRYCLVNRKDACSSGNYESSLGQLNTMRWFSAFAFCPITNLVVIYEFRELMCLFLVNYIR